MARGPAMVFPRQGRAGRAGFRPRRRRVGGPPATRLSRPGCPARASAARPLPVPSRRLRPPWCLPRHARSSAPWAPPRPGPWVGTRPRVSAARRPVPERTDQRSSWRAPCRVCCPGTLRNAGAFRRLLLVPRARAAVRSLGRPAPAGGRPSRTVGERDQPPDARAISASTPQNAPETTRAAAKPRAGARSSGQRQDGAAASS